MDTQPLRWWNGQSETTRRLGTGLAVCGTVVGALYLIVETAPTERAMRLFDESGRIAVASAEPFEHVAMNGPQLAIDASPVLQSMSVPIPTPSPLVAVKATVPAKHVASRPDVAKTKVAAAGGVEQFDRCLPQCETRDPLIAGYPQYAQAEVPSVSTDPAPVAGESVGFRPLVGARKLLSQAADVPGNVLRHGRQALDDVARIDW
ncbi:hypothetical protein RHSP_38930 [Rhizobium freirei PRF 81]|uniref:Uncharacterized protein n=1 Tax=Rhizobium freirei PRF 81 TaxID=363754 RepID=N6VAN7_9HYPH|nr:hypothetical protein [Rhizobium freirei]ENN88107.1 hypothetical protein RHSP_38930 [Rhizobium freirei PRF 81]